jgi:hypothetical protein
LFLDTALLQFAQIRELSRPNKAELKSLEKRADNDEDDKDEDDNGEKLPPLAKLRGLTLIAWNKSCFEDLITFKRPLLGLTAAIDSAIRTNLTDPLKEVYYLFISYFTQHPNTFTNGKW